MDIEKLSTEELAAHVQSAQTLLQERFMLERENAMQGILNTMKVYQISADEILHADMASRRSSPLPAKYRDPETGNTWTGRGRTPNWIRGKVFEDFLIS